MGKRKSTIRCDYDDVFRTIDVLMSLALNGFGIDDAVTKQYLEEHLKFPELWKKIKL